MADTTVPTGSPNAVKTWGRAKSVKGAKKPTPKVEPPTAPCSQFCTRLHQHTR